MRGWIAGLALILTSPVWAAEPIVIDGDTLEFRSTKFRLHGIDAPEFEQICLDENGQEWKCGLAARDALAKLIATRTFRCEDKGPDTVYHRRIGICFVEDMELNEWLVREGWALNFEPYAKGHYLAAQSDAAKNRRGIWKGCFAEPTNVRHWKKDAPLMGSPCPADARERIFPEAACSIKGSRTRIYHMPGCPNYESTTNVVKRFCSEDEARAEGYTKAKNCPR
jgi:endonuclease YncB( thermonuclease family)